jgi:flagellar L-ring protein FlgH
MKKILQTQLVLLMCLFLSSCSSYIAKMHSSIDRGMAQQGHRKAPDHFDQFRNQEQTAQSPAANQNRISSNQQPNMAPAVQRQYRASQENNRRTTANDLNDNDNSGSLWVNNGNPSSLYSSNKSHGHGDIILVDVYKKLRNEITLELQRAFPPQPNANAENDQTPEAQAAQANENATDEDKVYDRISTVIVEQINQDHVLLRGRKFLIFKSIRRLVEVQALISRRDITESDSVSSDSILESRISVLR